MPIVMDACLDFLGYSDGIIKPSESYSIAGDAYEGASRVSHELASYRPSLQSPDMDIRPAKGLADARSRDLSRNDANIQSGIRLRQDSIVGSHLILISRPNSRRLFGREDYTWENEFSEEVEELFSAYANSQEHYLDASGRHTLTGLARQAIEQHTLYGECLASVEWMRGSDRPFRTAIQMIDTDRLSTPFGKPQINGSERISMGVRLNSWGAPIGYHIRNAHQSDLLHRLDDANSWKYVSARLPFGRRKMLHLFEQHRPGQTRGIGTLVAAIPEMKMVRQFREIVLQNAILNATYAATVESDLDPVSVFNRLGGESTEYSPEEVQKALGNIMVGYYDALGQALGGNGENRLKMGGLKIPHLPPGSKLLLRGAGQGGPLGSDFESSLNRVLASAFGISYEQFSRDYTKTNYSSGKMASVETYKAMLSIKTAVVDSFATNVFQLWFEEAFNAGAITSLRRNMPSFYEGLNREWYTGCEWIGSSRGQVDELKETQAAILRISHGLTSHPRECARLGVDYRDVLREMAHTEALKQKFGLVFGNTTNMENALSGTVNEPSTNVPEEDA